MNRIILVPDSFKGTMSSNEVSKIMKTAIDRYFPECEVIAIPVADGGEGTVDCFLKALNGTKIHLTTSGPFGEPSESFYGIAGHTAIIEMAASAGFHLARHKLDPLIASTYGVGELILDSIKRGCTEIVIGLGGSCTNDAGAGMAAALGTKFYNRNGITFIPTGSTLGDVHSIDISATKRLLANIKVIAICDIDNPLYGKDGAAYVFSPQKGATGDQVKLLDDQLKHFARIIKKSLGVDVSTLKGAGAAGGMGAGVHAFLGGTLKQGIDTVLDLVGFDELLDGCDCVFTGEGKLDQQSLSGKVVIGVGLRARRKNVPVIAVVGKMDHNLIGLYSLGVTCVYETNGTRDSFDDIRNNCRKDLSDTMEQILIRLFISSRGCLNG